MRIKIKDMTIEQKREYFKVKTSEYRKRKLQKRLILNRIKPEEPQFIEKCRTQINKIKRK